MNEKVLVVSTEAVRHLFTEEKGFVPAVLQTALYKNLKDNAYFVDRTPAETDASIRQLIPYVCVRHENNVFVTERTKAQTESRLHNKLSIGLGGHINPVDNNELSDVIIAGMLREIYEEVSISGINTIIFKGYIYDNTSEVGQVHLGLLYEVWAVDSNVQIREVDKMNGSWLNLKDLINVYDRLETWSKVAAETLPKNEIQVL